MNLLVNGLITGAVFAIAASGLVVTYSTSGIFNFAHGALGMFCAYVYWDLRVNDAHHWPFLPKGHWPAPLALAVVLLIVAPAIGAFLYLVVIRGLEGASETVKLVVPISVLLGLISLANWVWRPDVAHSIQPFFGADHKITVFGVVLLWHDLTVLVVAGHGMFMNGMMVQSDNDNFDFANNAVRWLRESSTGIRRGGAFFVVDSEVGYERIRDMIGGVEAARPT